MYPKRREKMANDFKHVWKSHWYLDLQINSLSSTHNVFGTLTSSLEKKVIVPIITSSPHFYPPSQETRFL